MQILQVWLLKFLITTILFDAISTLSFNEANQYLSSLGIVSGKNLFKQGPFLREYDFVVVGAGAGGATVANRLSENPAWNVLLLEAGPEEVELLRIPTLQGLAYTSPIDWSYKTEPQENACLGLIDKRCGWPRGKELGGSTGINAMIYTRGHRDDYNEWAKLGNPGWSYDEVLPYFLKSEKASIELLSDVTTSQYHGRTGPLGVQHVAYHYKIGEAVLKGFPEVNYSPADYNDGNLRPETFSSPQLMERRSLRCSSSRAFLEHARYRPNFQVATNSFVMKVIIDPVTKTATGVLVSKNFQTYLITARKEVILSAGALNSPQLLLLSGVGPKDHLQELGIPVIQDLPVGRNLQDHPSFSGLLFTINSTGVAGNPITLLDPTNLLKLFAEQGGPLSNNFCEALAYISTKYNTDIRPDVEAMVQSSTFLGVDQARKAYFRISDEVYNAVYKPYEGHESWSPSPVLLRPKSVGYMKLKSTNPWDPPLFYPNYFFVEDDANRMVEAVKFLITFSQTPALQKYGTKVIDKKIPACKAFDFGSDDYWRCAVKHITLPLHHQCGTTKMGPVGDPTAVVSPELKVHGINNLRVVDAGIMPQLVSAHITAAVFMIGEKAADLIKSTYAE